MAEFDGQVAVITGASTGIGRAAARALASRGARVVLAARREDRLKEAAAQLTAEGFQALAVPTDVGDLASMQLLADTALDKFGRIDIALLNAGISGGGAGSLLEPDIAAWTAVVNINLYGVLYGIKTLLPAVMKAGETGSLLATTSAAGIQGTAYHTAAYATTKNAELTMMECLYGQLAEAKSSVHVGVVVPPLTRTNLAGDDLGIWERVEKSLSAGSPHPTSIIEPEQFAEVIVEGIRDRRFWIEGTEEQNARLLGGRNLNRAARKAERVRAKAEAIVNFLPPSQYLW
jgi:NAD(P)-dependent dehydrogenase (short-subunit alcohol dehydrogenase family)